MSKPWFRPKQFGYGASPASWQGWAATALFVAAFLADLRLVPELFADPVRGQAASVIGALILLGGLMWVIHVTGRGVWRWRWGDDKDR